MSARSISFLVGRLEDQGNVATLCDPDNSFSSRQSQLSAFYDAGSGDQDEGSIPTNSYVTHLDDQVSLFKKDAKPPVDCIRLLNLRKNGTTIKAQSFEGGLIV